MANLNPCGSGDASPRAGVGQVLEITSAAIQVLLDLRGYRWLSLLVGILPSFAFHPGQYCFDGPPERPTITPADALALLNLSPADELATATQKLRDLVAHYIWWDVCECSGATTVFPSDPQSPITVTGGPGDVGSVCGTDFTNPQAWVHPSGSPTTSYNMIDYHWLNSYSDGGPGTSVTDCKAIRLIVDRTRGATGVHESPMLLHVRFWDIYTGGPMIVQEYSIPTDHFEVDVLTRGYPYVYADGYFTITTENSADTIAIVTKCVCTATPTRTPLDCCPPDPNIANLIALLQADLTNVRTQVDLIQRQAVPFAYIEQTAVTGLTGHGHLNVTGLIGCIVAIEDLPNDAGLVDGDTQEVYADSWINWSVGSDTSPREWIRGFSQLSMPRNAGVFTRISYTLRPGVVVSITPLVREP